MNRWTGPNFLQLVAAPGLESVRPKALDRVDIAGDSLPAGLGKVVLTPFFDLIQFVHEGSGKDIRRRKPTTHQNQRKG